MKKISKLGKIMSLTGLMLLTVACSNNNSGSTQATAATTAGDTSAAVTTAESEQTTKAENTEISGNIALSGSTSMEKVIGILSEQFMLDNPGVTISYDATGSGSGVESAKNGSSDIGLASRNLKAEETGLVSTTLALDGIAMIVNEKNPVENLSLEDIKNIYTGKATNWADFGGENIEISCVGREAGSGTRDGFESITKTKDENVLAQELTSTGAVIEAVKSSPNAIAYASLVSVENKEGVKILTVDGIVCNAENISNGSYVIQRPFNLVTKEGATLSPQAEKFFEFITSEDAHELIKAAGTIPVDKK